VPYQTLRHCTLIPFNASLSLFLGGLRLQQAAMLYPWQFCDWGGHPLSPLPVFLRRAANDPQCRLALLSQRQS